jgi:hypothetical protein
MRHPIIKHADELAMLYEASVLKKGPGWDFTRSLDHSIAVRTGITLALSGPTAARDFTAEHRRLA